jgi:tetratricopeptide (TPR) repeat protein
LVIALIGFLLYERTLSYTFVGDDWVIIAKRESLFKDWNNLKQIFTFPTKSTLLRYCELTAEASFRPLNTFSYFIDYKIWGLKPFGYHLSNVIMHVLNGCLVYTLVYLLTKSPWLSLIGSLVFLLHPLQTEAVSVVSFREDILALFFYLLSFVLFLSLHRKKKKVSFYLLFPLIIISFLFAVLSKENSITLPFILCLYLFIYERRKDKLRRLDFSVILICMIISAYFIFIRLMYALPNAINKELVGEGIGVKVLTALKAFGIYINWFLFPKCIKFYLVEQFQIAKGFEREVLVGLFWLIVVITLGIVFLKKRHYILSLGLGWFILNLAPFCLIQYLPSGIAARYMYISMVGFSLIISGSVQWMKSTKMRYFIPFTLLLLVFYSHRAIYEMEKWRNDITFWERMKVDFPQDPGVYFDYGEFLLSAGLPQFALIEFLKANYLKPNNPLILKEIAKSLLLIGRVEEAEKFYNKVLEVDPKNKDAYSGIRLIESIKEGSKGKKDFKL